MESLKGRIWKHFFLTMDDNCMGGNVKSRIEYTNVVDDIKANYPDTRGNTQRELVTANTDLPD